MGGAYHGWSDQLAWGMRVPGTLNLQSHGVPLFVFKHTQEFFPNDLKDLEKKLIINKFRGDVSILTSLRVFRHFAVSMALFLYVMKL